MKATSPPNFSGNVDTSRWNIHIHKNLVDEAAYMKTKPPTLVVLSIRNR